MKYIIQDLFDWEEKGMKCANYKSRSGASSLVQIGMLSLFSQGWECTGMGYQEAATDGTRPECL